MLHPDFDALDRYQEQRLTPEESVAVKNHLRWCRSCDDLISKTRTLTLLMRKLSDAAVSVPPPP